MKFSVEQPLEVPRAVAEKAMVSRSFYASMSSMGPVGTPEVLSRTEEAGGVKMAVRYRFTGTLSRPARAVLDPYKLTWVIESFMHLNQHYADFEMLPDYYANRLDCSGKYRFEDKGATSVQALEGELTVHFPMLAGAVEKAILMGLRQNMSEQAGLIALWANSNNSRT
ncbi:MAG TPA: DUF2505 family protein [Acidimicrobiales bacterium]|nr:DUF2505 family protein [Acidimicrobiales bacterium]